MTEDQAVAKLRKLITLDYKQKDMARDAGVSTAYVSSVLNGVKSPSNKLLKLVGLEKASTVKVNRTSTTTFSAKT